MAKKIAASPGDARAEAELLAMLELFTDLGLLMHFNVPGLRELVVLKSHWLLNSMRNLLCLGHLDSMVDDADDGSDKQALLLLRSKLEERSALQTLRDEGAGGPWRAFWPSTVSAVVGQLAKVRAVEKREGGRERERGEETGQ